MRILKKLIYFMIYFFTYKIEQITGTDFSLSKAIIILIVAFTIWRILTKIKISRQTELYRLYFFPIQLLWKTEISLMVPSDIKHLLPKIKTFMAQNDIDWSYLITRQDGIFSYRLQIVYAKRYRPIKAEDLLYILQDLTGDHKLTLLKFSQPNKFKVFHLKSQGWNISLEYLLSTFLSLKLQEYQIITNVHAIQITNYEDLLKYVKNTKSSRILPLFEFSENLANPIKYRVPKNYGKKFDSKTNQILTVLNHNSDQFPLLYEYLLNELNGLQYSKSSSKDFDQVVKKALKSSNWRITIFRYSIQLGYNQKNRNQTKRLQRSISSLNLTLSSNKYFHDTSKDQIWKMLQLPNKPDISFHAQNIFPEKVEEKNAKSIGTIKSEASDIASLSLDLNDFKEGGIIAGAIGTGKTTLRLQIMKFLIEKGVQVIDFDIKGDATKYSFFREKGRVFTPGLNFTINLFQRPLSIPSKLFIENIYHILTDLTVEEELSMAQKNLLFKAIEKTVNNDGNPYDFFANILLIANQDQVIINNNQELTAQSLIVKFSWIQYSLRSIFWVEESTLTDADYIGDSLFFDLSEFKKIANHRQVRMIIELITDKIMFLSNTNNEAESPKTILFLDEAQILMPKNPSSKLTRLEETLSTLRYKGISIIAAGISSEYMSTILKDTSFVAQFRSESPVLRRSLGLSTEEAEFIPRLNNFHCLYKSKSLGNTAIRVAINKFELKKVENKNASSIDMNYLDDFIVNEIAIWKSKILSVFDEFLLLTKTTRNMLEEEVEMFYNEEIIPKLNQSMEKTSDLVTLIYNQYCEMKNLNVLLPIARNEPYHFLLLVLQTHFQSLAISLIGTTKINTLNHTYRNTIISAIKYLKRLLNISYEIEIDEMNIMSIMANKIQNKKLISENITRKFIADVNHSLRELLHSTIFGENLIDENMVIDEIIGIAYDLNLISIEQYNLFSSLNKVQNGDQTKHIDHFISISKEIHRLEKLVK